MVVPGSNAAPVLHRLRGSTCSADDWQPFDVPLAPGSKSEFGAVNGRSSADSPFFNLDWGSGGVITAVGWSGQWRGLVERNSGGALRIQGGDGEASSPAASGGEHTKPAHPAALLVGRGSVPRAQPFPSDDAAPHRASDRRKTGHSADCAPEHLVLRTERQHGERTSSSHLEAIKGLGFEIFWLDAYWTRDGFPAGMGHYGFPIQRAEPTDRFPHGLKAIGDAVQKAGMGFLMWFEPERVHPGTALAKEHPEWVISPSKDGGGLFNLGMPEAREYMTRYLNAVIQEYGWPACALTTTLTRCRSGSSSTARPLTGSASRRSGTWRGSIGCGTTS